MLDWAKAIHEALGIESPRLFILISALIGALVFGGVAFLVDRGYRVKLRQEQATEPVPSATGHPPALPLQAQPKASGKSRGTTRHSVHSTGDKNVNVETNNGTINQTNQ